MTASPLSSANRFQRALSRVIRAGAPLVWLETDEEARATQLVEAVASGLERPLHRWSAASGLDGAGQTPMHQALQKAALSGRMVLLCDPQPDPIERRTIVEHALDGAGCVLLLGAPEGLRERARVVALERPDTAELETLARQAIAELGPRWSSRSDLAQCAPELARVGLGLGHEQFAQLLAEALLEEVPRDDIQPLGQRLARSLAGAKSSALDPRGSLTMEAAVPLAELGGLAGLKGWLSRRARAFEPAARRAGIPAPKGVLLVGPQGCGKSLGARAIAGALALPLLRLDVGRVFGSSVGESERNARHLTLVIDRLAPCVVWLDEVDKGLAGLGASRSDAGTGGRVLATLLTWLNDRERPSFVVATANDIERLPPELMRRGRLDETFFVDLPDAEGRAAICRIHLLDRPGRVLGEAPPLADEPGAFIALAEAAEGFSGAEIEGALTEARLAAFDRASHLAASDFEQALADTVPLSRSRAGALQALRQWAETRARPAGGHR